MRREDRIVLDKGTKEDMVKAIKAYFFKERGEEMGDLASGMVLDFIIEELAPDFYNQGVMDAHRYLSERLEDMHSMLL
jgi:uncharacterized protein (DUF2164 family)